ncbi:MAG: TolC family outer membrane protein [Tatlockia sp.]|jgi:outer membrane protein
MKKMRLCMLLVYGFSPLCNATDLLDVYRQALENDPIFQQAYSRYMSNTESIAQARSALYPQVALSGFVSRNSENVATSDASLNNGYNSKQWQVNASQALFNYKAWAQIQQAKASVKASQATFNDAAQNLILRTANAYFQLLLAQDTVHFAESKKRANKRQFEQAEQRFKVGLDPITSVYEAKAAFDQSVAQVIAAKNNQVNQNENLRKLTNQIYPHVATLNEASVPLQKPKPDKVTEWVDTGLRQNYRLFAANYSVQAARENIKAQSAGNWPTFALQGNTTSTYNDANIAPTNQAAFYIPKHQTNTNVALAMNFPIFKGGLVTSQTRQSQYDFQTSTYQLEQARRDVEANSRIAFNTIIDGISKVRADRQTILSQTNALESTEAQFEVGTRTMVDVVNAQQRLFEAQELLAKDQYQLINAFLNLKYLAGSLSVRDIEEVNAWLKSNHPPAAKLPTASKVTK